jgi:hypothetical protein
MRTSSPCTGSTTGARYPTTPSNASTRHHRSCLYDDDLAAFARSKFVLLDAAQRLAIVAFFEAMAPYEDTSGALRDWGAARA